MSRKSLLDEAIAKAKEAEDWQLVEWLRMARGGESAARWYSDKLREAHRTERKLLDENAKLRELVRDAWGNGHPDRSCGGCDIQDECHAEIERMRRHGNLRYSRCLFERRIEERMHELGIEVSDEQHD